MSKGEAISSLRFTLNVEGEQHRVSIPDVTARQAGELALFFSVPVSALVEALLGRQLGPLDVAALLWLSGKQAGKNPNPDELLDSITFGTDVSVTYEGPVAAALGLDADPEA